MGKIVAIGGGSKWNLDRLYIDFRIIELSEKKVPKVLFIPTASGDSKKRCEAYHRIYGEYFCCETDELLLLKEFYTFTEIKEKIQSADIIFVGGGNTHKLMKTWKEHEVDKLLVEAYHQDKVLAGVSAGSICWFLGGHSDSFYYYRPDNWDFVMVKGLGLLNFINCPHYSSIDRIESFDKQIQNYSIPGLAIDDDCAIEFNNDSFKIISRSTAKLAYYMYQKQGSFWKTSLCNRYQYLPLSYLDNL